MPQRHPVELGAEAVAGRPRGGSGPRALLPGLPPIWKVIQANAPTPQHHVSAHCPLGGGALDLTHAVQAAAPFDKAGEVACIDTHYSDPATATHVSPHEPLGQTQAPVVTRVRPSDHHLAGASRDVHEEWSDDRAKLPTDVPTPPDPRPLL